MSEENNRIERLLLDFDFSEPLSIPEPKVEQENDNNLCGKRNRSNTVAIIGTTSATVVRRSNNTGIGAGGVDSNINDNGSSGNSNDTSDSDIEQKDDRTSNSSSSSSLLSSSSLSLSLLLLGDEEEGELGMSDVTYAHYTSPEYQNRLKRIMERVDREFAMFGPVRQFQRDAHLWKKTLMYPEIPSQGKLLERIFTIVRYGGLMYRTCESHKKKTSSKYQSSNNNTLLNTNWKFWNRTKYPIAAALSHGSRIIVQLPKMNENEEGEYDHRFWKWLITGDPYSKDLSKYLSTATTGNRARKEGKLLFRRLGATHALIYEDEKALQVMDYLKFGKQRATYHAPPLLQNENLYDDPINDPEEERTSEYDLYEGKYNLRLPRGRRKVLLETKTTGITFRDTKILRKSSHIYTHHRHWGLNLPIGGAGEKSISGKLIESNGEHGHMYLYYMSPKKNRFGGLLIGVEGSEFNKYDQASSFHGLTATSAELGPTFGFKWRSSGKKRNLSSFEGPDKYNSLLIDLTTTGWEFLIKKHTDHWHNSYVEKPSVVVFDCRNPNHPQLRRAISEVQSIIATTPATSNSSDGISIDSSNLFSSSFSVTNTDTEVAITTPSSVASSTTFPTAT